MKKTLSLIITTLMITGIISACAPNQNNTPTTQPSQPTQPSAQPSQPEQSPELSSGSTSQVPTQNTTDTSNFIGEERAKQIALQRAGISADGVIFDRVELDRDNGVWHYEVEFRQGRTEYDADIKADDGTVISFESDYDD